MHDYTKDVLQQLKSPRHFADMVQIGNEINHGILWDGNFTRPDSLAALLKAGVQAVKEVSSSTKIMLHIALWRTKCRIKIFP